MDAEEVDELVETLYVAPQKLIYAVLSQYQKHSEEIIKSLCVFAEERMPEAHFTEEKIRQFFGEAGTVLALNVMNDTSEFVQRAITLRKELLESPFAKMLVSQIARKHIIYNGNIDHREIDKLLSGDVLAAESKPTLLLSKGTGTVSK